MCGDAFTATQRRVADGAEKKQRDRKGVQPPKGSSEAQDAQPGRRGPQPRKSPMAAGKRERKQIQDEASKQLPTVGAPAAPAITKGNGLRTQSSNTLPMWHRDVRRSSIIVG